MCAQSFLFMEFITSLDNKSTNRIQIYSKKLAWRVPEHFTPVNDTVSLKSFEQKGVKA